MRFRLPFEPVGRVGDPEAAAVVGAAHRALALLDDVGQLMGQGVPVTPAVAQHDVVSRGVRASADLGGRGTCGAVVVDAYVGEVGAEPGLHVRTGSAVQGLSGGAQYLVHGGTLHRRLSALLMPAARIVLVRPLGPRVARLPQHLDHGRVPRRALKPEQPLWGGALGSLRCARRLARRRTVLFGAVAGGAMGVWTHTGWPSGWAG